MIRCLLAPLLLAFAVFAQITVPSPVIAGTNPLVSIGGHEPGEPVVLVVFDDPDMITAPRVNTNTVYYGTADANGVAHFRPHIPWTVGGLCCLSDGMPAWWPDPNEPPDPGFTCEWIIGPWQIPVLPTLFALLAIIVFEGGGDIYHYQHVISGHELLLYYDGTDWWVVVYE